MPRFAEDEVGTMPSASTSPVHQVLPSHSVDFEMFCQSLVLQGLDVTSTFISYAENFLFCQTSDDDETPSNAMMGLWGWVQRRYRSEEAEATKELLRPLPQPVTSQQHTDLITESLEEMKTQLQLIHAVVDDLQAKGEQTNRQLNGLHDQLRRVPTCRCGPQEKNTRVVAPSTKTFPSPSNAQNSRAPTLELTRLELPMMAVHRSTLHEQSDAIFRRIIQEVDGSFTHPDGENGQRFPLHVASEAPGAHEILGKQSNRQLNGLQDQLRRVPTCRCGPQEYVDQDQFEDRTNALADQDPGLLLTSCEDVATALQARSNLR